MRETTLTGLLRLDSPPVAITFTDHAPPGVPRVSATEPAGCGYWRRAAAGPPLAKAPVPPDVVLVRGNARQLMLLAEAAQFAGVAGAGAAMGRPTCAVLPEAINSDRTALSFGCVGNRVYTGASDNDAYFAIPGSQLAVVEEKLSAIVRANQELEKLHRGQTAFAAGR